MSVALTGGDTIKVGTSILNDLADGNVGSLDFPNNIVEAKRGKNGNTIFALNETGQQADLEVRVLLGSADDKRLNAERKLYMRDPPSYVLLGGEIVKRSGDGAGDVANIIYPLEGGCIKKIPNVISNVEGDTEQAVVVYTITYANGDRAIS